MKTKILLLVTFALYSTLSFSQATTGKVSYDVYVSSENPQMAAYISQMENSLLETYFTANKLRSDLFIGDVSTTTTVSIKGQDSTLMLLDNMMTGKLAMKATESDLDDEQREAFEVTGVEFIDGETKEIMGYSCKKAIVSTANGAESEVWYTEEIVPPYRKGQFLYKEIPGMPLEMYSTFGSMNLKMVAFDFKEKINKKSEKTLFSFDIPKGYTFKTAAEMKQFKVKNK